MTARQIPAYLILSALLVLTWASLARGADPAPAPDPLSQLSIQQFFIDGGTIGYIIAGLSLAMVALMFEHMLSIRRGTLMPSGLAEESHRLIMAGQFKQAEELCRSRPSFLGYLLAAGLAEIGIGYAAAEKAMEDAAVQQSARLQRKVEYLSIIGTIAPMLGLMGTVWGMILAFMEFEKKANPQVSELAPGVYKALRDHIIRAHCRDSGHGGLRLLPQPDRRTGGPDIAPCRARFRRLQTGHRRPSEGQEGAGGEHRPSGRTAGRSAASSRAAGMRVPSRPVGRGLTFNITPLIDVVFLLNIFFLVATYYITNEPAVAVDLPGATLAEKEDDVASRLIVTVRPDGTLSLAGVEISLSDVNREISLMMTEHGAEQCELRIRADKETPYRFVEPLLLAAARQGVTRVRYAVVNAAGGN